MVDVSPVKAFDDELAREAEVLTDLQGLFVYVFSGEVLSDAAVVRVAQFDLVVLVVEQIVYVYIVHIALYVFQVDFGLFVAALAASNCSTVLSIFVFFVVVLFFFLVRLVVVGFFEPGVREDLWHGQPLLWLELDHAFDECLRLWTQLGREGELSLQNELVQIFEVRRLKGHRSAQHSEEKDAEGPDVDEEAFIALVNDDLRRQVSRSTALLLYNLAFLDYLRDTEVAYLDALLAVEQDVIQFDVSVDDRPAMNVRQPVRDLLEDELGVRLLQLSLALDQSQEVAATSVLHDHEEMLA